MASEAQYDVLMRCGKCGVEIGTMLGTPTGSERCGSCLDSEKRDWTLEEIRGKLRSSRAWQERTVTAVEALQGAENQNSSTTIESK